MEEAKFTDEELEYIYVTFDVVKNEKLVKSIEDKIRKQIKHYYDFDHK